MYTPSAVTAQPEIQAAVDSVAADLKPDVRQIWWNIGQDWSGDWAIFFRVLLSDSATRGRRLSRVTDDVRRLLVERTNQYRSGLIVYCNFRGESEQAALTEGSWK